MATRRQFIRISAMGAGAVAAGAAGVRLFGSALTDGQKATVAALTGRTPTYCEVCFWKCAGWVYKDEKGTIQKIIGNNEDMNCNGRFCPRGTGGVGMYYDEDRLRTPLIRTEERGRHVILFCESLPCHVVGGREVLQTLKAELQLEPGQTSPDKKWTLLTTSCLGVCNFGPVISIDGNIHGNLTPESLPEILKKYE